MKTNRGPKINRQKNPAAREVWIKQKKERNALKPNPLDKVWHDQDYLDARASAK